MKNELGRWLRSSDERDPPAEASEKHILDDLPPVCFVVDEEERHRHFMSLVLQGHGIETGLFASVPALRDGLARRKPDLVFLDVPAVQTSALDAVRALAEGSYHGPLQLMSERGDVGHEDIMALGERNSLRMLRAVKKPVERAVIKRVIQEQKLDVPINQAERIGLDVALKAGWIEFWYQPKIDLRRKQLGGVELFARVRHPRHGMMSPASFMEGADDTSLIALTEKSLTEALATSLKFGRMGINQRLAVNVTLSHLVQLPLSDILKEYRPNAANWSGLILDITEDQIANDFSLVRDVNAQLEASGIQLAIDDFGRGYVPLARFRELPPFAELKLDRAFVADCALDRSHAAMCKSVIDLAHNFGSRAVAVGVEKPADASALTQMDCDLGQGYLFAQPMAEDRFHALLRQRADKPVRPPAAARV